MPDRRVLEDESEHLDYGEVWLNQRFAAVQAAVSTICLRALVDVMCVIGAKPWAGGDGCWG